MKNYEDIMQDAIIEAYIQVMGVEKWNSLTHSEKDKVLHLVVNDLAKYYGIK